MEDFKHYTKLEFLPEYFSNENWHPSNMDMDWMGEDEMKKAIAEWQAEEDKVIFNGFRVNWESCDCGDGYGCSHGRYPYDMECPFENTDMSWEDDGFYIENKFGFIRFDRVKEITMGDFITACSLLRIPIEKQLKSGLKEAAINKALGH